jgi:hypothetical protein
MSVPRLRNKPSKKQNPKLRRPVSANVGAPIVAFQKSPLPAAEYDAACGVPIHDTGFPRSADDLHLIMMGRHGLPIYHREFDHLSWKDTKFRSFYIPYGDRLEIYYANGMPLRHRRYYKQKNFCKSIYGKNR